jgi:hypothetical protein
MAVLARDSRNSGQLEEHAITALELVHVRLVQLEDEEVATMDETNQQLAVRGADQRNPHLATRHEGSRCLVGQRRSMQRHGGRRGRQLVQERYRLSRATRVFDEARPAWCCEAR